MAPLFRWLGCSSKARMQHCDPATASAVAPSPKLSGPAASAVAQLGMAQRMAQLYREAKEERATKCTELEGVVQELKAHMEVREGAERLCG